MRDSKLHRGLAGAFLAVICVLTSTACDKSSQTPTPPAPPAPSVWEQTLAEVDDDGNVSVATATKAYSIAIQPLPGVSVPAAARTETIPSGTVAVRWLLRHWDALTPQQRQAVVGPASSLPARRVRAQGRNTGTVAGAPSQLALAAVAPDPNANCVSADAGSAQSYRAWGDGIVAEVGKRLGHGLDAGFAITYAANTREAQGSLMYAVPCRGGKDLATAKRGPIDGCTVHVNPSVRQRPSVDQRALLIHEVMHCVLYDEFDYAYNLMPNWYGEGLPTWVQSVLGEIPVPAPVWSLYMDMPNGPLYRMHYQAVGFFVHLAESGTNPWTRIVAIGTALKSGKGGAAANRAGWDAAGVTTAFLDTWGPSFAAGRYPGPAWTTTGPNVPKYLGHLPKQSVSNGATVAVASAPAGATLVELQLRAEVVLFGPGPTARGRLAVGVGVDLDLSEVAGINFCTKPGGCECPESSPGAGTEFKQLAGGPNYLGVTGGPEAATVSVIGLSLDEFCGRKRDVCLVGSWTTTSISMTAAGMTMAGGAGVRMVVDRTGKMTVTMDGMAPVRFSSSDTDLSGHFVYHGGASGRLKLPPPTATSGVWEYVDTGQADISASVEFTSPFRFSLGRTALYNLAGQAGGGGIAGASPTSPGRWTCSGNTLRITPTQADFSGGWNWRRTG
jgi:hypothetical protein